MRYIPIFQHPGIQDLYEAFCLLTRHTDRYYIVLSSHKDKQKIDQTNNKEILKNKNMSIKNSLKVGSRIKKSASISAQLCGEADIVTDFAKLIYSTVIIIQPLSSNVYFSILYRRTN